MTFVILTGGIDLSVGAVAALSGVMAASCSRTAGRRVVIPLSILAGSLIGLVVGLMIHVFEMQPFIATLAAMFLARGLCYVISLGLDTDRRPHRRQLSGTRWALGGGGAHAERAHRAGRRGRPALVLHLTRFGRTVYAIGGSEASARLMGLPVARTKVLVYVISGTAPASAGSCSRCTRAPATR